MRNHIILYRYNNTPGKKDATGAFIPEAKALEYYLKAYGDNVECIPIDLTEARGKPRAARDTRAFELCRLGISAALQSIEKKDLVAHLPVYSLSYFCHGWRRRVELEHGRAYGAHRFAETIVDLGIKIVNLFACSCAMPDGDGNYARWVAEACADRRHAVQVMGHETKGHTTCNAKLRVYWSTPRSAAFDDGVHPYLVDWRGSLEAGKNQLLESDDAWPMFRRRMQTDQNYRLMLPYLLEESF